VPRRQDLPTILVYIAAGLVLGPVTGLVGETEAVDLIAEVGIALLLFLVGLELNLAKIRDVGKVAVIAGIGQVVFTAAGGFVLSWALGFTIIEAVFLAVALTFSSTVVVVKLLDEKKELDSLYGRIAVGIFLVQDLVVIVALTFLSGLANPEDLAFTAVAGSLGLAFAGMGALLAVALLASRFVLGPVFGGSRGCRRASSCGACCGASCSCSRLRPCTSPSRSARSWPGSASRSSPTPRTSGGGCTRW
jgi:Kef-type K+ transport system membrane component KefB